MSKHLGAGTVDTRTRILDAALHLVRAQGYAGTSIDDLCREAGVTKGAFFHHFASKEALGIAAAEHWTALTSRVFAGASYHQFEDPVDRILAYIGLRRELVRGELPEFTCFAGTIVQEVFGSHTTIRDACGQSLTAHAATLVADFEAARVRHDPGAEWSAESLALHTQAVIQGAFVVAKATNDPQRAIESIDHLDRYIRLLFHRPPTREEN